MNQCLFLFLWYSFSFRVDAYYLKKKTILSRKETHEPLVEITFANWRRDFFSRLKCQYENLGFVDFGMYRIRETTDAKSVFQIGPIFSELLAKNEYASSVSCDVMEELRIWIYHKTTNISWSTWLMILKLCTVVLLAETHAIHRIHNGAQTTKSRLDRLLLLCFAGLHLSKAAPRISFSCENNSRRTWSSIRHFGPCCLKLLKNIIRDCSSRLCSNERMDV